MNYRGSYRHLSKNSRAAMASAIETYNRPRSEYRDETFSILLINAWELLLKAILSKNGESVFYRKKRHQPYRTLSWQDAFDRAKSYFPRAVDSIPVRRNLELVTTYRDNAIHFYNEKELSAVIWTLAQTSILNYRDLLLEVFGINLATDVNWRTMPLGAREPSTRSSSSSEQDKRPRRLGPRFVSSSTKFSLRRGISRAEERTLAGS